MRAALDGAARIGLALALVGGVALAQDTAVKKPKRPRPVSPPAASTLRSAVRSRWSTPASIASRGESACRTQCATTRIACLAPAVEDEVPRCNAGWTSCLSTCDGFGYARAPFPGP